MRVPNDEIRRRAGIEKISTQVRRWRWKWIGHVLRMAPNRNPHVAKSWAPCGKRSRGRQGKHGGELWRRNALIWDLHRGSQQQLWARIGTDGEH